ncbi:MAG TPA: acyl-CoA dehydrogenase family protein [Gaiellaceae bacterium]|nr:acyl-CoA dehydrogenase family protein [Gaiellaceae bacterium]
MAVAAADLEDLRFAARGVLDRHWPIDSRLGRDESALATVWREAVALGWAEIDGDAASTILLLLDELGRANCGIPLLDAHVAATVLGETEFAQRIATGETTVAIGRARPGPIVEYLEETGLATHVLVIPQDGTLAELYAVDSSALEQTASIGPYGWARLDTSQGASRTFDVDADRLLASLRFLRFGLAARGLGAARRAHELAIDHATTREQFGEPIGRFQAVSHRAATGLIDLESSAALLADAADALERGTADASLVLALATEHTLAAAPRVVLGALHTLGGMGFHEEHEGAWLFRRVHSDVARAIGFDDPALDASRLLIEQRHSQPDVDLGDRANSFRAEIAALFDESWNADRVLDEDAQFDPVLREKLVERGWLGAGWPKEWGGQERTPEELLVLNEEIRYRGIPVRRLFTTVNIVGGAILKHGTDEQKRRYLPGIRSGETLFCLGYSEPEAGSDLASLRTTARRSEGGWIVNGQKIFTTFGHRSHYHWLAVRTDPEATPPHAGISVFIVPLDTPGITIQENHALNGETTTTTYYDEVFVPDEAVIGAVNGGWKVIGTALSVERIQMGGNVAELRGVLDALLNAMRDDPDRLAGSLGSWQRQAVVELTAWLRAVRLFVVSGLNAMAADRPTRRPAAMAKVAGGETAGRLADVALRILGPGAMLAAGAPGAVLDGEIERLLRLAPMYVIGGGTNDIQRNLIARELGLPR